MHEEEELTVTVDGVTHRGTWSVNTTGHVIVSLCGGGTVLASKRANTPPEQLARTTLREMIVWRATKRRG